MVLAGGQGQRLYPLTKRCAKPALRFGGAYRIIDFTLSNCINSGVRRIYVLAQYASTSLIRHIRQGWAPLLADALGEFIEVVPPQRMATDQWYAGTADAIYQNLIILQEEQPEVVLLLSGDHAYKMDYRLMLQYHFEKEAVLTIACQPTPVAKAKHLGVMQVDENGQVTRFLEKPAEPPEMPSKPGYSLVNMGVYVWSTRTLARYVAKDATQPTSHDFGRDIIPAMVENGERVFAYPFVKQDTGEPAYWRDIGTLENFWESHMDLVATVPELDLYDETWPLYTARGHFPPAKTALGESSRLIDSLICDGCVVSGGTVIRSVLAPCVRVEEGAEVVESVLFDGVVVGRNVRVWRAIIDEGHQIPEGFTIGIDKEADRRRFVVSEGGLTIVPAGAVLR
ncbi:MAG: glucose-1-phosphate adenylyltransferase [Armatimonadetes bacterium]|nr:glucose-1-phosphate adenylyltransferase [Armatimonadota bacterium]